MLASLLFSTTIKCTKMETYTLASNPGLPAFEAIILMIRSGCIIRE